MRNLEREIASVARKVARKIAEGADRKVSATPKNLRGLLGQPKFLAENTLPEDMVGIVCGLAWTESGGDLLFIEASARKGKKELILTGNMGNVMKESAQAALSYIKARSDALGIDDGVFDQLELHIHVPQGAIPKDGPSAGITMAAAMVSTLTGMPVDKKIAMTGEITLTGRVLPIGGLKEKTLAALRAGIARVIIPEANKNELEEMPSYVKRRLEFLPVKTMEDVITILFRPGAEEEQEEEAAGHCHKFEENARGHGELRHGPCLFCFCEQGRPARGCPMIAESERMRSAERGGSMSFAHRGGAEPQ